MALIAIGLMSGTSMDGVDVAIIETDGESRLEPGPSSFTPYADADRALLRQALQDAAALADRQARPGALAAAEAMVTRRHAEAVEAFLAAHRVDRRRVDVVGFHGQTVLHSPERRLTVQLGDGAALSRRLRLPVVFDLRAADVAAGGQGAPLTPAYHRALAAAAALDAPMAFVNIGGVSNVTLLAPGRDPLAFDAGPGNALLDDLVLARTGASMDRDGAAALAGRVDPHALAAMLAHPFFAAPPPKSLDRNAFSSAPVAALALDDAAATLVAFTAEAIAVALRHAPVAPEIVVVCGGGARNPALMAALARRTNARVEPAEARGWSSDAMEAQAFAYLAVRSLRGLPLTFPTTTGVARSMSGGVLELP